MMKSDGSIVIDTRINSDGVEAGVNNLKTSMTRKVGEVQNSISKLGGTAKKVGAAIAAVFAVKQVVQFGKECLELGSDLQEVQNVVDVTFPAMTKQIEEFARKAADSFGLSETMAKRYVGTFGSMAKSFGYSEEAAYDMATALTGLTGDVASFYNLSQEEAYTKLKSVFTGETETLKDLGVVMTQAALDQYALANGIGKTTDEMTEQEKVALRFRFVQDQLSAASGDFARTSDSWANQTRIFELRIQSLKATIGQGLINLFTPIIKAINVFLEKLSVATTAFKDFTELIMGKKSAGASVQKPADVGILQNTEELSNIQAGYEGAAEGAEEFADSVKNANKEVKGALAPFDELNVLQFETEENANAIAESGGVSSGVFQEEGKTESPLLNNVAETLDDIKNRLVEIGEIFKTGFWEGMGNYKPVLDELARDLQSIGAHFKDIFTDADVLASANRFVDSFAEMMGKLTGSIASIGLTIAANLVGGMESYLSNNAERLKTWLSRMFDIGDEINNILGKFFAAFADVFSVFSSQTAQDITGSIIQIFMDVFGGIVELTAKYTRDILAVILTPFTENADRIKLIISNLLSSVKTVIDSIADTVRKVVDGFVQLYDEHIHPLYESIKNGLTEILEKLLDGYNEYIVPVFDRLANKFKEVMDGPVGEMIDKALRFIGKVVDAIKLLWEEVLQPFLSWIAEKVYPVVAPVLETIGNIFLDVFGTIAEIIGTVFDVLSGLIDFITGVFTGNWEKAWTGVKDIFSGIWEGIVSVIEGAVNIIEDIVEGIKKTIDSIFGTKFSTSSQQKNISNVYSVSYPPAAYSAVTYSIPRLATGTVVPPRAGEFAAILGDNNRETEVVSPLSTMKQALKEALLEAGMTGNRGSSGDIYLQIDGKTFARLALPYMQSEEKRVGVRLVTGDTT